MRYSFDDQCGDFIATVWPEALPLYEDANGCVDTFEVVLAEDRKAISAGREPSFLSSDVVHALDVWLARQPLASSSKSQNRQRLACAL